MRSVSTRSQVIKGENSLLYLHFVLFYKEVYSTRSYYTCTSYLSLKARSNKNNKKLEMETAANVSSLFIYPIKSCRGISLHQVPLTPTGFRFDRQWMIVNQKGRAYTQRVEPKLALVEIELPNEASLEDWEPTDSSYMAIRAPGMKVLRIPLSKQGKVTDGVSVWEWSGSALDEGDEASEWFTNYLGKPSRLVRFNGALEIRPVNQEFAGGHNIMFSDCFPFLLLSQGSMNTINQRLTEPISANRFRPNILVDGCEPWDEDLWLEIRINHNNFQGVKLCDRCKVPSINQETGIPGTEPAETLKEFRTDNVLRPNHNPKGKIYVGQNIVWKDFPTGGEGKLIKVGDPVYVIKKVSSPAEAVV